jgi:hypothetical protein
MRRALEALQRLRHEGNELITAADEGTVIVSAVRPVARAHGFEVKAIHAPRIRR